MNTLARAESASWLAETLGVTLASLDTEYRNCARYSLPADTGKKTALAHILCNLFDVKRYGLFWITAWGIFPSSENMALFYGFRKSFGEDRELSVTPGHVFSKADMQQIECMLCLSLYFYWDASLFDDTRNLVMQTSHDEFISIRATDSVHLKNVRDMLARLGLEELSTG